MWRQSGAPRQIANHPPVAADRRYKILSKRAARAIALRECQKARMAELADAEDSKPKAAFLLNR
jgi:hypothetical protein